MRTPTQPTSGSGTGRSPAAEVRKLLAEQEALRTTILASIPEPQRQTASEIIAELRAACEEARADQARLEKEIADLRAMMREHIRVFGTFAA